MLEYANTKSKKKKVKIMSQKKKQKKSKPVEDDGDEDASNSESEDNVSFAEDSSDDELDDERINKIINRFITGISEKLKKYSTEIVSDATNILVQDVLDYLTETEEDELVDEWLSDSWKTGLLPAEIKKRTIQLKNLVKELDKDLPTLPQILDTDLPNKDKAKAIKWYDLLNTIHRFSPEYDSIKNALMNAVGKHPSLTEEQLEICQKMENKMSIGRPNDITLKQRVYLSEYDEDNMRILSDMVARLDNMHINDSEYAGIKDIVDTALALPVKKFIQPAIGPNHPPEQVVQFLINLRHIFDQEIYGMSDIKDYIIEIIGTRISNPEAVGDVIAFEGPPGTGKTLFVKCIAKALNLPMEIISLAGAHDPSYIEGFLSTYSKSTHGRLVGALKKIQCNNGIILWDEADKIDETRVTAVSGPLIVIFDPEQNTCFKDKFLGDISIDVSKLIHFLTINSRQSINFIAANRMDIIPVRGLSLEEKVGAARLKTIPEAIKKAGLSPQDIMTISDDVIRHIITKAKQQEAGMRHHKRNIERIFKRINVLKRATLPDGTTGELKLKYYIKDFRAPFTLTKEVIDKLMVDDSNDNSALSYYS
jgi:ATP-dependent Lon protease